MIRSMTGFGDAERDVTSGRLRAEIKSVNHRFFNNTVRLPSGLDRHEPLVVDRLKGAISRGNVTFTISFERTSSGSDAALPELDVERARAYAEALARLSQELGLEPNQRVSTFVRFPELFRGGDERSRWSEVTPDLIGELTDEALERLVASREAEGERLRADFLARLDAVETLVDQVERRVPERLDRERERLLAAVAELTDGAAVDPDRLAREIAYLADKWDLSEEIVRLRSHVALFRGVVEEDSPDPAGKRLGFVLQEMNREANTIASKANDTEIAHAAVGLKEEIERLREQVENVE